ncbi:flavin-nucleotide-binding protein [Caenimonas sedimenti]|uniref:Flavin-nucleotide-binding protein n=1 Tax=Caenimonas sedimenti TaxID=2596921 RepID=A0A562ZHL5_9BURK|nr:pyridoxamine 5'-phosphate oxidase family protein [Caenimonas sedimenti]TWO67816.1 flavin-nucleotide-binding protein [Caenimonas sedimenti]
MTTPAWHAGEVALQQRVGSAERLAAAGPRVLRDHMPDQHREFFAELPFVLAGTLDAQGQPWASVLAGRPGFAHSPEPHLLRVDAAPLRHDPLDGAIADGMAIGLLGIQHHTRRRNRMNGWVRDSGPGGFTVEVGQSFGNCPKYIDPREFRHAPPGAAPAEVTEGEHLDEAARAIVRAATTFYIATAHPRARDSSDPAEGVDVSHRGGPAGFVRIGREGELLVPDYLGNAFFNTLGNLQLEPRCGLLFLDAARRQRLYLAATASLQWDGPEVAAIPGAQRLLKLRITAARRVSGGLPLAQL